MKNKDFEKESEDDLKYNPHSRFMFSEDEDDDKTTEKHEYNYDEHKKSKEPKKSDSRFDNELS